MLQIRYHPNFKSADTLLFAGSHEDIARLRSFFQGWEGDEVDVVTYLQAREKLYLLSVTELRLMLSAGRTGFTWQGDKGTWLISKAHQEQIVDLLDGLLDSDAAGHQYIDVTGGPDQIMVAKDEYALPAEVNV